MVSKDRKVGTYPMIVAKDFLAMPNGTWFYWEGTACALKDSGSGWTYPFRKPRLCKRLDTKRVGDRTLAFFYDDSIGGIRYITVWDKTADEELYYLYKTQKEAFDAYKAECQIAIQNVEYERQAFSEKCDQIIHDANQNIAMMDVLRNDNFWEE